MYLMPAQVLFLLHHAPAAKLLRIVDASTLAGLRAAAVTATAGPPAIAASAASSSPSASSALAASSARDRVAAFRRNADDQAREQALKRRQFQEASGVAVSAADEDQGERQAAEGDSKRQKISADSDAASSPSTAAVSADSTSAAPADAAALPLPANSSYQLAMSTFPPPPGAEHSMHTGHPLAIALPLLYPLESAPLIASTRLNQLELRTVLTHQARPAGVREWAEMQRLVYENACEALGLRLHDAACPAAPASSSSPRPHSHAAPFASSSAWVRFLRLYGAFRHLWSLGYLMLPGAHFGGDLMAYEDLPSRVHSSFLVKLLGADGGDPDPDADADARAGADADVGAGLGAGDRQLDQQATAGQGCFSISMLSNLARMASSINKAVLLVQPCMQPDAQNDQSDAAPSSSSESDVTSDSGSSPAARPCPCPCPCLSAFAAGVRRIHSARMQCHTFHWNLTPSLAHAPFANDHLVRTQLLA